MQVTLKIQRFNPDKDSEPHFQTFEADVEPTDRLLSVLVDIKERQDPTLDFRKSCAHGVCGSDAMRINGSEALACKTLIRDAVPEGGGEIIIEPLRSLPVQKDLCVAQGPFFEKFASTKPFFINDEQPPAGERHQSPEEHHRIEETTNCILCECCYSACPVVSGEKPEFIGPAASLAAIRFNNDSRDRGESQRADVVESQSGLWACDSKFECTRVCPRGIKITKQINLAKRAIKKRDE